MCYWTLNTYKALCLLYGKNKRFYMPFLISRSLQSIYRCMTHVKASSWYEYKNENPPSSLMQVNLEGIMNAVACLPDSASFWPKYSFFKSNALCSHMSIPQALPLAWVSCLIQGCFLSPGIMHIQWLVNGKMQRSRVGSSLKGHSSYRAPHGTS